MPPDQAARDDTARPRYSYRDRVLHAFVVDGRLTSIPARERKRHVVLRYLAETDVEEGRDYPERELDQRLALRHRDVAALRRYLVDGHYLERSAGIYRRRPTTDWPVDPDDAQAHSEPEAPNAPQAPGELQAPGGSGAPNGSQAPGELQARAASPEE